MHKVHLQIGTPQKVKMPPRSLCVTLNSFPFHLSTMPHLPPRRRFLHRHKPNNVPHQLCECCFNHLSSIRGKHCTFCRQAVAFIRITYAPMCSSCYFAPLLLIVLIPKASLVLLRPLSVIHVLEPLTTSNVEFAPHVVVLVPSLF